ncbi:MAG TPA: aminotransferase class I/II-fold pyridoxal phosphate-dependent enzyme [bacterium]|nr:aminotransferase class I/II-fold pyridoxal phosphate-dependent enzyme [bacterium]HPN31623.1 aminotransferase class I/II-fold pyridoxal phosphate-dependent enzyme [bacterium]
MKNCINLNHGGNVLNAAANLNCSYADILDFSNNLNPLGIDKRLLKMLKIELDRISVLPEIDCKAIRKKISGFYNTYFNNVLIAGGSSVFIYKLNEIIPFKSKILLLLPNYSDYYHILKNYPNLNSINYFHSKKCYAKFLRIIPDYKFIVLSNPNNPIGYYIENLDEIIKKFSDTIFIIDESYIDFVDNKEKKVVKKNYKNAIIIKSLTKTLAAPGLRIGIVRSSKDIIFQFQKNMPPWPINSLVETAVDFYFLYADNYLSKIHKLITEEKKLLFEKLSDKFECLNSDVNFFLLKIKNKKINATQICNELLKEKILLRNCSNINGLNNRYLRVAVKKKEENKILINKLLEIV